MAATWTDLLDPSEEQIREQAPAGLQRETLVELLRPADADSPARPTLRGYADYVFGILVAPVVVPEQDVVFYQEVDLVLASGSVLTVRKTPTGRPPFDSEPVRTVCEARGELPAGMIAYYLVDEIAERYLDMLDALDDEIDELEAAVEDLAVGRAHKRLSELRQDLLRIRRTLAPLRDAVRGVVDGRVDLEGKRLFRREVFSRDVEIQFGTVYEKLLRATESLEFARDLLAAVRDYHQTRIANDQNGVIRRLTAVASLLLFPTFLVGVYGQNFEHMPELGWKLGYLFSWGVIAAVTIGQIVFFRWRRWI